MSKPPEVLHMVPQLREKKPERKRKNLIRLGVNQGQAYAWTRMGGWAVAQSPILGTTITLERLRKRGYVSLLEMYEKIAPSQIFRETALFFQFIICTSSTTCFFL